MNQTISISRYLNQNIKEKPVPTTKEVGLTSLNKLNLSRIQKLNASFDRRSNSLGDSMIPIAHDHDASNSLMGIFPPSQASVARGLSLDHSRVSYG